MYKIEIETIDAFGHKKIAAFELFTSYEEAENCKAELQKILNVNTQIHILKC